MLPHCPLHVLQPRLCAKVLSFRVDVSFFFSLPSFGLVGREMLQRLQVFNFPFGEANKVKTCHFLDKCLIGEIERLEVHFSAKAHLFAESGSHVY